MTKEKLQQPATAFVLLWQALFPAVTWSGMLRKFFLRGLYFDLNIVHYAT
jgi:hypothetical protein